MLGSVSLVPYQYKDMAANDTHILMEYTHQYLSTTSWKGIISLKLKLTNPKYTIHMYRMIKYQYTAKSVVLFIDVNKNLSSDVYFQ